MNQDGNTDAESNRPLSGGEGWNSPMLGDIELMRTSSSYSTEGRETRGVASDADIQSSKASAASGGEGHTTGSTMDDSQQEDEGGTACGGKSPPPTPCRMPSQGAEQAVTRVESSASVNGRSSFSMPAVAPFSQFGDSRDQMAGNRLVGQSPTSFLDINKDVREEYLTIARAAIEVSICKGHTTSPIVFTCWCFCRLLSSYLK